MTDPPEDLDTPDNIIDLPRLLSHADLDPADLDDSGPPRPAPIFTSPRRQGDLTFVDRGPSFELWFSDRLGTDHHQLIDECADWLEEQPGVQNLGQLDFDALVADGRLDNALRAAIVTWWSERLGDLSLE